MGFARANGLIAQLLGLGGKTLCYSAGSSAVLVAWWIGSPKVEGQHFALDTTALSILGLKPDHPHVPIGTRWNSLPTIS